MNKLAYVVSVTKQTQHLMPFHSIVYKLAGTLSQKWQVFLNQVCDISCRLNESKLVVSMS